MINDSSRFDIDVHLLSTYSKELDIQCPFTVLSLIESHRKLLSQVQNSIELKTLAKMTLEEIFYLLDETNNIDSNCIDDCK
jgi:hypothetical protein